MADVGRTGGATLEATGTDAREDVALVEGMEMIGGGIHGEGAVEITDGEMPGAAETAVFRVGMSKASLYTR